MKHLPAAITVLALVMLSEAQHQAGYCAFYDECGRNPSLGDTLIPPIVPCLNYSPARHLTGEHYQTFKKVCPMLDEGEGNTYGCCSIGQLSSLERSLSLSKGVLNRCPSCAENFAHMHCMATCSPNQTQSVKVTKVMNVTYLGKPRDAVVAYNAYINNAFAETAFQSCKNVRLPATGGFAISTMCGRYGATLCTPQRWYDFQGDSSNGLAPLDINFFLLKGHDNTGLPEGVIPYNGRALGCNESTPSGSEPCSCQDCKESCPSVSPPAPPPPPFRLFGIDGFLLISIILSCVLTCAFLLYIIVSFRMSSKKRKEQGGGKTMNKTKDKREKDMLQRTIHPSDVSCADKTSLVAQDILSSVFQRWGTLMASYPLTVLLLSAIVVAVFFCWPQFH